MKRRRIENQIVISIMLIVVLVLACSLAAYTVVLNRNYERKIGEEIASGRAGVQLAVTERKHRAQLIARLMAANPEIRRGVMEDGRESLITQLSDFKKRLDTDILSVIDLDGVILAQVEPDPETSGSRIRKGDPVFLSPLFKKAVMGESPDGIELCLPDVICINAYSPIMDRQDDAREIIGFVRAGFALDDRFAHDVRRTTGTDYILLRRSRALASSIPSESLPDSEVRKLAEAISDFTGMPEGNGGIQWLKLGNIPYALEAAQVRDDSGRVLARRITGRNTKDIESVRREGAFLVAGIALIALLLAAGFSVFVTRRIFNPLRSLMDSVREITKGRLDARIDFYRNDEIGELGSAFNEMSLALTRRERSLREAAEEIRVNQDQLIQSGRLAAIGELAAGVAHEIGNPLSAISGYAQLLKKHGSSSGQVRDYAGEIERETEFIEKIIQELLDFSRPSEDVREPADLRELTDSAIRTASSHKAFSNVRVDQVFSPDLPRVPCHKKEIVQVLINLLVNAAQAMPEGGAVRIEGELKKDSVVIRVRDEGEGIPEELKSKIFDPFFTTKPTGVGTGLGLPICYRIIDKHGGRLTFENREQGACFSFTLPHLAQ